MLKKLGVAATGALIAVSLLACGVGDPGDGTTVTGDTAQTGGTATPADGPVVGTMGGKGITFEAAKLGVVIGKPQKYKPSPYMDRVPKGSVGFVFTVKLINESTEPMTLAGTYITANVGKESVPAEQVFDTGAKLNGVPGSAVLPGKSVTFWVGFTAPTTDTSEITLTVTPQDLGFVSGLFTGKL